MTAVTRVMVVEDEPIFRQLLLSQLAADATIEVVGEADTGEQAIALADELEPEVILMDIELKGKMTGIEAGHRIKKHRPSTGIVLLSNHRAKQFIITLAGWSYLLKRNVRDLSTVVRAIKGAAWGMIVVDPQVTESLTPQADSPLALLDPGELKILELLAQGYPDKAIADDLLISVGIMAERLSSVFSKLSIVVAPGSDPRVVAVKTYFDQTRGL